MPKTFYITTAIDYTNSAPHIGHAYEKVLADVIARYHRLKGEPVYFLTGVDQHGQKVQQSAEKREIPPQQFVAGITEQFIALWDKLEVRYDGWAATTNPLHKQCVQGMLERLWNQKQLYRDKQSGYYSVRQEQFLTDKERGPDGNFGPEWGTVEYREEENYYFTLSSHKEWLLKFLSSHPAFVTPSFRQTELVNAVEKLGGDLCISRPKSRLNWGIELPFDPEYVNYVWFDALSNYLSFVGYDPNLTDFSSQPSTFLDKWPALHVIGKDIMVPAHGIYWPIMLHALGFPDDRMPGLLVHGWWNIGGAKMSKSVGNSVDPNTLVDKYGAEAVRYYLMSDIVTGKDADFSEERLVARYNSDLANNIGNLVSRTLNMLNRFCHARLNARASDFNSELQSQARAQRERFQQSADEFSTPGMLAAADCLSSRCNEAIDREKPWELAKDRGRQAKVACLLYELAEAVRLIALFISPVLPRAAHGVFDQLQWKMELGGKEERFSAGDMEWGQLPEGHVVGKPAPLFPRFT
ncbi:MAG: methionine--tRNA ligase [Verrucomicrobia bacterium]|nr:methionine--tRNA ligase [Verrucomicrobiota bacterium]